MTEGEERAYLRGVDSGIEQGKLIASNLARIRALENTKVVFDWGPVAVKVLSDFANELYPAEKLNEQAHD